MCTLRTSALLVLATVACAPGRDRGGGGGGGKADDPTAAPYGLDERPANPTCVAPGRPPSGSNVTVRRVFPSVSFTKPLYMVQRPGSSDDWYVVEQRGVVYRMPNVNTVTPSQLRVALDHRARVEDGADEAGLLGLAFHPGFASNGRVFLSYTINQGGLLVSVVTEMHSADGGLTFDAGSERTLLSVTQPFENHNGGHVAFGPDGYLYVGFGDGGWAGDPSGNGQKKTTRLGKLLRIDVDGAEPFAIPADNPFAGGGGLPEIYAFGLRNPWRFDFDRATGDLWLADVGQDEWEEIDLIERGGNYGWNLKEADACFAAASPCEGGGRIDPVIAYDHSQGDRSITGGHVYRGPAIPSLVGSYLYGDYVSGRIWGLFPGDGGWRADHLVDSGVNITSFAQGHDGEILVIGRSGTIRQIVADGVVEDRFPRKLSETGCFDGAEPAAGLIPYDVNAPLWSDGADKERWLAIPDGQRIRIADGDFDLPIGSVLVKTFRLGGRRVETRLLIRHDDGGWAGYAYEWNAAQTDADLLPAGKTVDVDGRPWHVPGRAECTACHTEAAGRSLGLELAQLNRTQVYPSTNRLSNQLATLAHIGLIQGVSELDPDDQPVMSVDRGSAEARAKAYLHGNCSHCHRPGGPGRAGDLRYATPLGDMDVCNATPVGGSLGISGARLLRPGDPSRSLLSRRMSATDASRMPPVASAVVDDAGVALIDAWIESLSACP